MPPAFLSGYYTEGPNGNTTLGDDMGDLVLDGAGTKVAMGRKLMRGSWNAEPFGVLNDTMTEGLAQGTDLYFNKSMLSAKLCGIIRVNPVFDRSSIRSVGRDDASRSLSHDAWDHNAILWRR